MGRNIFSIRTRLILFLVVLVLLPVLLGFLIYHRAATSLVSRQLITVRRAVLEQNALNINRITGQLNTSVNFLAHSSVTSEFLAALEEEKEDELFLSMQNVRSAMQMIGSAAYMYTIEAALVAGSLVVTTIPDISRNLDFFSNRLWQEKAWSDPRRLHWTLESYPFWTEEGFKERDMLIVSRRVGRPSGTGGQGVMAAGIDMEEIYALLDQSVQLSLDGTVPAGSERGEDSAMQSVSLENGWSLYYIPGEEERLGELVTLQNQGMLLIVLLSIALAAIIIINVFMATRSLQILKERMQEIQRGDLSVRMPDLPSDEIGMLAQSINDMLNRIQELFCRVKEEHCLAEEARFAQLKSQISPHFLLNSLNSVTWAAKLSGADNVGRIASSLSSILERALYEKESFVPLSRELDTVRRYLILEELRSGDLYDLDIDSTGLTGDPYCPAFSLQPLVENALKHGIDRSGKKVLQINVYFHTDEKELEILVEDTGPGFLFDPDADHKETEGPGGIGLPNIHQRVQTCFGADYGISVEKLPLGGSRVHLRLPLLWEHP